MQRGESKYEYVSHVMPEGLYFKTFSKNIFYFFGTGDRRFNDETLKTIKYLMRNNTFIKQ